MNESMKNFVKAMKMIAIMSTMLGLACLAQLVFGMASGIVSEGAITLFTAGFVTGIATAAGFYWMARQSAEDKAEASILAFPRS